MFDMKLESTKHRIQWFTVMIFLTEMCLVVFGMIAIMGHHWAWYAAGSCADAWIVWTLHLAYLQRQKIEYIQVSQLSNHNHNGRHPSPTVNQDDSINNRSVIYIYISILFITYSPSPSINLRNTNTDSKTITVISNPVIISPLG